MIVFILRSNVYFYNDDFFNYVTSLKLARSLVLKSPRPDLTDIEAFLSEYHILNICVSWIIISKFIPSVLEHLLESPFQHGQQQQQQLAKIHPLQKTA